MSPSGIRAKPSSKKSSPSCMRRKYGKPELWDWYSAYDHVAFAQLFGRMIDLPGNWPRYTRDLKQWYDALDNPQLPSQINEYHALNDAC